ncbi:MAG: hypothetical protein ABIV25_00515 [Paracoccaceae bacterium]
MRLILPLLIVLATPAAAQSVFDRAAGQYGSATDPATSCATNPHVLSFMAQPPHLVLEWQTPKIDADGGATGYERFDLLDSDDTSFSLRWEGSPILTYDGQRPTWILRLTDNPQGYCMGRTDWPVVRCEDQQVRCEKPLS